MGALRSKGAELFERATSSPPPGPNSVVLQFLLEALECEEPRAAYCLGTWYLFGVSPLNVDFAKAREFFEIAAAAHIPEALYELAICCEAGEGGDIDVRRAFELMLRAALHGNKNAIKVMARYYSQGVGIDADARLAAIWKNLADDFPRTGSKAPTFPACEGAPSGLCD